MNIEELRDYCLSKNGVTEGFPFNETALVFKVEGKMFCMTDLEGTFIVNLKNHPSRNIDLRERYSAVRPGYHMNKQHWNTVEIDGSIPDHLLRQLIDESYQIVVEKLPLKKKMNLKKETDK
jgi:predicted DNA-binding protein (MmcQ/YjbR family)